MPTGNTCPHENPSRLHMASVSRSPAMQQARLFTTREGSLPLNKGSASSNHCRAVAVFSVSAVSSNARPISVSAPCIADSLPNACRAAGSFRSRLLNNSSMPRSRMAGSSGDSSPATTSGASSA